MIKKWIEAMRLRTLPVSVAGVIAGTGCAIMLDSFKAVPALTCLLFAILAQIAANFGNEYYDFRNGSDDTRLAETGVLGLCSASCFSCHAHEYMADAQTFDRSRSESCSG